MNLLSDTGRRELKYFIQPELIQKVKSIISPFIKPDPYARNRVNNTYTIRSIYFDTKHFDFYHEKMDGLKIRKKIRVRFYNDYIPDGSAFLEIKRRYDNLIVKERTKVPLNQLDQICIQKENPNGHLKKNNNAAVVLSKFLYNLTKLNLEPSILVTYEREAYVGLLDDTVRVTFDKDVRVSHSPKLTELFADDGLEYITNGRCILELKFNGFMPKWMRTLVAELNIRKQSISKYCMGVDACQRNIVSSQNFGVNGSG